MAIYLPSRHVAEKAGHPTRMTDRALAALETWIDMRTRRERARLDALMARTASTASPAAPATEWWRSWRACKRRPR